MNVADVGTVVRAYRRATGMSQKDLAALAGLSRSRLNYLESGRDIEIGAAKLFQLLEVLGVRIGVPEVVDREQDERTLEDAARAAAGKDGLPRKIVLEAFATGRVPAGSQAPLRRLLDQTPAPALMAIVRAVASGAGQPPKSVWRHGRQLAEELGASSRLWLDSRDGEDT